MKPSILSTIVIRSSCTGSSSFMITMMMLLFARRSSSIHAKHTDAMIGKVSAFSTTILSTTILRPAAYQHDYYYRRRRRRCLITTTSFIPSFSHHHQQQQRCKKQQQQQRLFSLRRETMPVTRKSSGDSDDHDTAVTGTTSSNKQNSKKKKKKNDAFVPKTIAVIGSGAVGCYYGSRLWEGGHDVRFYMRNVQYDTAVVRGLNVTSDVGTDVYIPPEQIQVSNDVHTMEPVDWIIVSLKSTGLQCIPKLIQPLLRSDNSTRILVIMNGMIEDDLIKAIKVQIEHQVPANIDPTEPVRCCQAIYGGMALICSNRIAPARVHHSYFGLLSAGVASTRTQSSIDRDHDDRIAFEQELFWKHTADSDISEHDDDDDNTNNSYDNNRVAVDIAYEDCLVRGRWKKMIWNLPFNGISVAMGGITVDQIVADVNLRALAYKIMDETILIANTELQAMYGSSSSIDHDFTPLGDGEKNAMMKLSDDMGAYKPSTMLDLVNRRSMEVAYLFTKPLEKARALNISAPHLETIVAQIQAYQRIYNLY